MREVTKSEFKEIYCRVDGGRDGWDQVYWNESLEHDARPDMTFTVEAPEAPQHVSMMIVTDCGAHEHRLFFMTEDGEGGMRQFPHTAAEDLLERILRRDERAATILTSNRPVDDWGKLLGDTADITALLDRLLHHVHGLQCDPRRVRTKVHADLRLGAGRGSSSTGLDRMPVVAGFAVSLSGRCRRVPHGCGTPHCAGPRTGRLPGDRPPCDR